MAWSNVPFRAAVVLGSVLRVWQPRHRTALSYLVNRGKSGRGFFRLHACGALGRLMTGPEVSSFRTQRGRGYRPNGRPPRTRRSAVEIIVSANGCTDDTASTGHSCVAVPELSIPSKAQDSAATAFPRLYVDADVTMTADATTAQIAPRPRIWWRAAGLPL